MKISSDAKQNKTPGSGRLQRLVRSFVSALSHRIARLNMRKRRGVVGSLERGACLRMRASLLVASHPLISRDWSATRYLVLWLDPVSAGLWPHLRRSRGLGLRQRLARFLVARSNPSAAEALFAADIDRVDRAWHGLQLRFGPQSR